MTFLFVFAHPDDESFSGAGTVMTYAQRGVKSVLVTATLGERGKCGDPPICSSEELPAVRERELRKAVEIIGFDQLHLLGYRDRELPDAPPVEIRQKLVRIIRQVKPNVIFTFDPNGMNVHPDHVAISRFATEAIAAAADARWHPDTGAPHDVPTLLWTPPVTPWDAVNIPRIEDFPGADYVVDVSAFLDRRIAALEAHRSQHISIDRCFFSKPNVEQILAREIWRHGAGARWSG